MELPDIVSKPTATPATARFSFPLTVFLDELEISNALANEWSFTVLSRPLMGHVWRTPSPKLDHMLMRGSNGSEKAAKTNCIFSTLSPWPQREERSPPRF